MKINQKSDYFGVKLLMALTAALVLPVAVFAQVSPVTWGQTNTTSAFNWNAGGNWVGGTVPTGSQSAVYVGTNAINPTIVVDASTNIQDFYITRAPITGSSGVADATGLTVSNAPGQTLSVLGPNGFVVQHGGTLGFKAKMLYTFNGNAMVVSNTSARFVLNSGQTFNQSSSWDTYTMSGLTNLNVAVNLFAIANSKAAGGALVGDQGVQIVMPRTNIVTATLTNDFTQTDFTNSVEIARMENTQPSTSFAQNAMFELGYYNAFYCDSFGIGRGNAPGNTATMTMSALTGTANGKNSAGFNVSFANVNSATPTSSALFRNTNGTSRVSLLAIGVDSGTSVTNNRNNGILNLIGGKIDMLVDQVWLGRNRTNAVGNSDCGGLAFDNGTVDANTIIAGDMQYTNPAYCIGLILVGTNGVLKVNNYLELGHTPANDPSATFGAAENQTVGQLQINKAGTAYVNQINVGLASTNNAVTVNSGGLLVVTNTIAASPTNALTTLTLNGQLTLNVNPNSTNVFVTNMVSASGVINIGSINPPITTFPKTVTLVSYQNGAGVSAIGTGSYPNNYNNIQVQNDSVNNRIIMIASANLPRNLVWKGGASSSWNHTDLNWFDTNAQTTVAFSDNDKVVFDDSTGVPQTITVDDTVIPGAMLVTNSVNHFVFSPGSGSIGGVTLTKAGTASLQLDCASLAAVQVNQGTLTGSGSVSSITVNANGSLNFAGTDNGGLTCSGSGATLAANGVVNGSLSVQPNATFNNYGSVNGSVASMGTGSTINNYNQMTAVGSFSITTNSTFNNVGPNAALYGNTVTVALGGTLVDTVAGSTGQSAGSLNVQTLLVNGTFKPGGNAIGTTKVTDYYIYGSGPQLAPNGRVQFSPGSTNIMYVNAASQSSSEVLNLSFVAGPSQGFKAFNGGTIVINNTGGSFAAGQTYKLFGYYYDNSNFKDAGLNTTNSYPIIQPATPGAGLVWDLSSFFDSGSIGVLSASDPSLQFSLTNNASVVNIGGNTNRIAVELSWPADKQGGWLQTLSTTLTNGLSATNWVSINGNYNTNVNNMSLTNVWYITNTIIGDPTQPGSATFYRFVWP